MGRPQRGSLDHETVYASRNFLRAHDARQRFSPGDWPAKARNDCRTGAGGNAVAGAELPGTLSGQDRQLFGNDPQDAAQ